MKYDKTKGSAQASAGFTLLEVMVAVSIMAVALVAVFGSQSQSVTLATEAKFSTTAAFLAQSKMAEIEAGLDDALASDSGDFGEDFPGYLWEVEVSDVPLGDVGDMSDHLRQVDLAISWGEDSPYQYRLRLFMFVPETD